MNKFTTDAVILRRVNFSEADRIMTFITPKNGKIRAIAKGVRKEKSKLAGGLELLSVSAVGYIKGKGDLDQIVSSRLNKHYGDIVTDYGRVSLAYKVIEWVGKLTEDDDNQKYYDYLVESLASINDLSINLELIEIWARIQLLLLHGNLPNLLEDCGGEELSPDYRYSFDPNDGCFKRAKSGLYTPETIKIWRILTTASPKKASRINGVEQNLGDSANSLQRFMQNQMHVS